jgi:hypothetical protein
MREACLRIEYARLYENVPAGEWIPTDALARRLVERARELRRRGLHRRTFDPRHFEFRPWATVERAHRTGRLEAQRLGAG